MIRIIAADGEFMLDPEYRNDREIAIDWVSMLDSKIPILTLKTLAQTKL